MKSVKCEKKPILILKISKIRTMMNSGDMTKTTQYGLEIFDLQAKIGIFRKYRLKHEMASDLERIVKRTNFGENRKNGDRETT